MPSYPDVRRIWNDGSGLFGLRWTLSTSNSAILSALLAILLGFTLSRLLTVAYTLLHVSILHRKTKSFLDDQVNIVGANNTDASGLLFWLLRLAYVSRMALSSTSYRVLVATAIIGLAIQGGFVLLIGGLFLDGPVPITLGTCGKPARPPSNVSGLESGGTLKAGSFHLFEQA